jgi:thiosulfate dehydrogenase
MFKGVLTGVVLTLLVALGGGYFLLQSGRIPANADADPSQLETWLAKTSLDATLDRDAPKGANPVALSDANLQHGAQLFLQNCAVCHGGAKGSAAPAALAAGFFQKPPQLASDGVEDDPEGVSFWVIKHGIRMTAMPSFAHALSDQQIWTLALFLKHMDKLPPAAQSAWQQAKP